MKTTGILVRPFVRAATALTFFTCAGCGSGRSPTRLDSHACDASEALFVASDYTSSGAGALSLDGTPPLMTTGADLGGDPALAVSIATHRAFYVARDQDAVFELDRCSGAPIRKWRVSDPTHVGAANPQDVAVAANGSLWVARYNVPTIAIVDPGGGATRTLDLARFDGDGNPNASAIRIVDDKAFVVLERVDDSDGLKSKQSSSVVRIDTQSGTVEAEIVLEGRNPFAAAEHGGALWLAEPGDFYVLGEPSAGIERFDFASSTSRIIVHENDLGGSVSEVAVADGCGAAIVADATGVNATSLVLFDPVSGHVIASASHPVLATPGFSLEGLAWIVDAHGLNVLVVGDRGTRDANGYELHVFDREIGGCSLRLRPGAISIGQKPIAIHARP